MATATHEGPTRPARWREARFAYTITTVLLLVTMVALLAVPTYSHLTPTLGGIPFFYWYTVLWLVINAVLQIVAYQILSRARRPLAEPRDTESGP